MLAGYSIDLSALQTITLDEYQHNKVLRGYVERTLQVCVQICLDISYHLIAELGLRRPENNKDSFAVLSEAGIIPQSALPDLVDMAGFRNIIVHDYARVDNTVVYHILTEQLHDFSDFANAIVVFLNTMTA